MTNQLGLAAFASLIMALVAAALLYAPSGTSASSPPSADFEMVMASVSYEDLDGNPITEIPEDQDFRVRVEFMFNNNGPDSVKGDITVAVAAGGNTVALTAAKGCENVLPSDGVAWFITPDVIQSGGFGSGFSTHKVRCMSVGPKQFGATVSVLPLAPATDPNEEDNTLLTTGPIINVTADPCPQSVPLGDGPSCPSTPTPTPSPTPTPTPVPTPTPTPTPVGQTPSPTPVPTPQGDNDCDGDVDAVDGLRGLQQIAGLEVLQEAGCPELGTLLSPTPTPVPTPTPTPTSTSVGQTPSPTPVSEPQGDNDCDEDVDVVDPLKGVQHVSAIEFSQEEGCPQLGVALPAAVPAGDPPVIFGDVDCDADVDAVDQLKILRFLVGFSVSQTEPCPDIGTPLGISGPGSPLTRAVPFASAMLGLFVLAGVVRVSTRSRGR